MNVKYNKARIGDMKKSFSSPKKIKNQLKWRHQINLMNGLKKTIRWYLT